jgi:L-seryl-tRNA(Ser) seleniumtransferase
VIRAGVSPSSFVLDHGAGATCRHPIAVGRIVASDAWVASWPSCVPGASLPNAVSLRSEDRQALRRLPSVEALAAELEGVPHALAVAAARSEIEAARRRLLSGADVERELVELAPRVRERAGALARPSLRPVINATGTVLHTNLGRAPLAPAAVKQAMAVAAGYSNLEYDLEEGARGSRMDHLRETLATITGAEAAIAVNNNAAGVLLALAALARGRDVVVSRGELVEIGGAFRIPEIIAASGARLVEVGTTNRTRIDDYERAIGERTAAVLRVHQSNFRTVGFVAQPSLRELALLAKRRGLPLVDDLGSGAIDPIADEPTVRASVDAGVALVCFSADKLLGGPQAGIICGRRPAVEDCARHPLARALRLDKMQVAALETTLRLHRDGESGSIPALAMLHADAGELQSRAELVAEAIGERASVITSRSLPGGGSLPVMQLEGPVCAVDPPEAGPDRLAARLREHDPPVIARIEDGLLMLDPRTFTDEEAVTISAAVLAALGR